jgi:hypothetical protein
MWDPTRAQRDRIRTQLPFRSTETLARNVLRRLFIRQSQKKGSRKLAKEYSFLVHLGDVPNVTRLISCSRREPGYLG